jgi:AAA15 family ATPase/GTPase
MFKEKFTMDFSDGVNIFIGSNGSGKTTILRGLYRPEPYKTNPQISLTYNRVAEIVKFIYIPVAEMLSHSRSLMALDRERWIPFLKEEIDILAKAQLGEIKQQLPFEVPLLKRISEIISGEVIYENDTFYVLKNTGEKVEFSAEASGYTKFGLLWKLIRNGLLREDTVLLWDEPENSINPELIPDLVNILLELSKNGVQVFVATHEYSVARWFDIKSNDTHKLRYFNLTKTENSVKYEYADSYLNLSESVLRDADTKLFNAVVTKSMEED